MIPRLENVSGRVLEEYRDVICDMIRGKSGIYALYRREKLYYVGLASNLMTRLNQHLSDRHKKKWDRFSVYLTRHDDHMKELESLLLRIVAPEGNKVSGKFRGSTDLRRDFARHMRERDADNRAMLLGGKAVQRRQKKRAKQGRGTRSLNGVLGRRMALKGWRNGWEYSAALLKNGTISYDGERYDTPTAAARAAIGRGNGWAFWHFKDRNQEWIPLRSLRK